MKMKWKRMSIGGLGLAALFALAALGYTQTGGDVVGSTGPKFFSKQTSDPVVPAGKAAEYVKDVGGKTELFFKNSNSATQLTENGALKFTESDPLAIHEETDPLSVHTEVDPLSLHSADTDNVKKEHIDWGTGEHQVNADDIPASATKSIPVTADVAAGVEAHGWGNHAEAGYLTTETDPLAIHEETDPLSLHSADTDNVKKEHIDWGTGEHQVNADDVPASETRSIPLTEDTAKGVTAYGWGDHSQAGYLTQETDPLSVHEEVDPTALHAADTANVKASHVDWGTDENQVNADSIPDGATKVIPTSEQTTNWDAAYGWGNHADAGYLFIGEATEGLYPQSMGGGSWQWAHISADEINNGETKAVPTYDEEDLWNTAYNWGDHASAGYLTSLGSAILDEDFTANGIMQRTASGVYGTIADGQNGQYLKTDGEGGYSWGSVETTAAFADLTDGPGGYLVNDTSVDYETADDYTLENSSYVQVSGGKASLKASGVHVQIHENGNCNDAQGNHNCSSSSGMTYGAGKLNNAATLDNSSSYQNFGDVYPVTQSTAYSYSVWLKNVSGSSNNYYLLGKKYNDGNSGFDLGCNTSVAGTFNVVHQGVNLTDCGSGLNDGSWHHVVVTHDGTNHASGFNVYIDGTDAKSSCTVASDNANNFDTTGSNFFLGGRVDSGHYGCGGAGIDEFQFYPGMVLSAANVATLYNGGSGTESSVGSYPTASGYYVTTSAAGQVNTANWPFISSVTITDSEPTDTQARYLVSVDGRTTWKYWNGSAWTTSTLANIHTNGNSNDVLVGLTKANWDSLFTAGTFDLAVGLKTTDGASTPEVSAVSIAHGVPPRSIIQTNSTADGVEISSLSTPTSVGASGQLLKSNGDGTTGWYSLPSMGSYSGVCTVSKSGSGDYTTIQAAMNAVWGTTGADGSCNGRAVGTLSATNKWAVVVYPGRYEEQIAMKNFVSLVSAAGPEVTELYWSGNTVITATGCSTNLMGFKIAMIGGGYERRAVVLSNCTDADYEVFRISGNHFYMNSLGNQVVGIYSASGATRTAAAAFSIDHNYFTGSPLSAGIKVKASGTWFFDDNVCDGMDVCAQNENGSTIYARNNMIKAGASGTYGFYVESGGLGFKTYGNTVTAETGFGIHCHNGGIYSCWSTAQATSYGDNLDVTNVYVLSGNSSKQFNRGSFKEPSDVTMGLIQSGYDGVSGQLKIYSEQGATDRVYTINPNAAATQDVTLTLPPDDGNAGEFLQTDGSGALTFAPGSIKAEDVGATCTTGTVRIDTGGDTTEFCYCSATDTWKCAALTAGPAD